MPEQPNKQSDGAAAKLILHAENIAYCDVALRAIRAMCFSDVARVIYRPTIRLLESQMADAMEKRDALLAELSDKQDKER